MNKSLGDYIVDRTESLDKKLIKEYFIDKDDDKIVRLLDSEQYLLEGSRGIGKTMLMKKAEIIANENFGRDSILAVWVSFEESIRIERIKVINSSNIDPFLQWTMGKILIEILSRVIELRPTCLEQLSLRLAKVFNNNVENRLESYTEYMRLLNEYIELLERAEIEDNNGLSEMAPSEELARILDNPTSFRKFLIDIVDDFDLKRIVLLFDEAAHVFSFTQQEKFFTFFKSLRHPKIACKVSVYPGITNYGKYFERNQDAKELRIAWSSQSESDLNYIKNIIKKRIKSFNEEYWNKLTVNDDIISTICICSNGNPRFAFHIIDEMQNINLFNQKNITYNQLINCLRRVIEAKWKDFITLSNRMVKYKEHIIQAEEITKDLIIPNLREWNNKRRKTNKKLSIGFYLEETAYKKLSKVFDILAYSNFMNVSDSKKSIGHSRYGYYISINPSLIFADLVLKETREIKDVSNNIDNNQVYSEGTYEIGELISLLHNVEEYHCSNNKCDFVTEDESFTFCKKCGSAMIKTESESLYKILRSHSIEHLNLSSKIILRLKSKFATIGEIYDADIDEIRMSYIQDVRIEKIKNAAIEYMAG